MDEVFILLMLAALSVPVLLVVLTVWSAGLSRRARALEDRLTALEARLAGAAPPPAAVPPVPLPEPEPVSEPAPTAQSSATPRPAETSEDTTEDTTKRPEAPDAPPRAFVLRADRLAALAAWLRDNWIYAVSATSLAAAGLFFVQYGIEAGLLPPLARVVAALAFGAALVAAGEVLRRRWGDRAEARTAFLPSVFSGAGIVTLFGAILAALHLYGLLTPAMGFAGLVAVAALGIGLGWYGGPLLAAVGLAGGFAAPFVVGGESAHPELFFGYFTLVALLGLAIDAGRRWAWVSVLALAGGFATLALLWLSVGWAELYALALVGLVLAAIALPGLCLSPRHAGAAVSESLRPGRPRGWPEFPTRLAAAAVVASGLGLWAVGLSGGPEFWVALGALIALVAALAVWGQRAEALEDLTLVPLAAFTALPVAVAVLGREPWTAFRAVIGAEEGTPVPVTPYLLVVLSGTVALMAAWRSRAGARWPLAWAAAAAATPPAMVIGLDLGWRPDEVLGGYPWALAILGLAAAMTALALGFGRLDGAARGRVAVFALAAIFLIALALTVVLTEVALTLAYGVTLVAAAALDRRFGLRPLGTAVALGALALLWRALFLPGLDWAMRATYGDLVLGHLGGLAALYAAWRLYAGLARPVAKAALESVGSTLAALFVSVLIARLIEDLAATPVQASHWGLGLMATTWGAAAFGTLWRARSGGRGLVRLRRVVAGLHGLLATLALYGAVVEANPLWGWDGQDPVLGPALFNTLAPAYLVPAALVALALWRGGVSGRLARPALAGLAGGLALLWAGLAIRHLWRGAGAMNAPDVTPPELYSYTLALLLLGAGLLYQAIARGSPALRKLAMAVIGLTVAKVFLIDAAGLVGLLRVFSFLALGLSLAGLAFLNRWAAGRMRPGG